MLAVVHRALLDFESLRQWRERCLPFTQPIQVEILCINIKLQNLACWENNPLQSIQIGWWSRKIASPANQSPPSPTVSLLLMWWGVVSSSSVQLCLQIITQYYVCNLCWLALSTQPGDENKWIEIGECFYFHHWWQSNQTAVARNKNISLNNLPL